MKVVLAATCLLLILHVVPGTAAGQQSRKAFKDIEISMDPKNWRYDTAATDFIVHRGVKAMRLKTSAPVYLKEHLFSNGTIEFDIEVGGGFPGIAFRMTNDWKDGESFYIRYFGTTSPESRTTLQYCATIGGVSTWDLSDEYQAGAVLNVPGWNHVRMVVSGYQMKVFVNNMTTPALVVPRLEGESMSGGINFSGGAATIANLVIKATTENLDSAAGLLYTTNETRFLCRWKVSQPQPFEHGRDVVPPLPFMRGRRPDGFPDSSTVWSDINAEPRGIINLTRKFGPSANDARRLVWLKTTLHSDQLQERRLHIGFSDEIWLFVNGQLLYVDKNHFGTPGQKFPKGRCTIENATITLPLKQGENEVLIALSNYFYGWGMIMRLDDTNGIRFE
jgi:hypothetical protein